MRQSIIEPRRRPVVLNSAAARSAAEALNGTIEPTTERASASAPSGKGPQQNSDQATALIASDSFRESQVRRRVDSGDGPASARIRKLVSRCTGVNYLRRLGAGSATRRERGVRASSVPRWSATAPADAASIRSVRSPARRSARTERVHAAAAAGVSAISSCRRSSAASRSSRAPVPAAAWMARRSASDLDTPRRCAMSSSARTVSGSRV